MPEAMINVFSRSEPGGHPKNEDAYAVQTLAGNPEAYLCVIADGQGGRAGGGEAARVACQTCLGEATRYSPAELLNPGAWHSILTVVDRAVSSAPGAGYTTVAAHCISNGLLCGASCGDSAVSLFSRDDSFQVLTSNQQKNPPVGTGEATFVPFAVRLISPWIVLAMSDGVWKFVGWDGIFKAVKTQRGDELIRALRRQAQMQMSGALQDDFTLVILQSDCN